jgi:Flp pilus assembly protein TadG
VTAPTPTGDRSAGPPLRPAGRRLRPGADGERGSTALQLVMMTPVFLLLLLLTVAVGRLVDARQQVQDAAHSAARAATLASTPGAAQTAADQTAAASLSGAGITCTPMNVQADIGQLTPGSEVSVTISCTVSLAGLGGLDMPGSETVSSTFRSVVDQYGSGS